MQGLFRKSVFLPGLFAAINIAGLVWIHHDLTRAPRATVRVLSASLQPNADNPDRIRLAFDRQMVSEAAVGRMEKTAVFQVAPVCPGSWIWSARDTLEYLLDSPLPQGRLVKVSATGQLKVITARSLEGPAEFELPARPLRLVSTDLVASDQSDITLQVTFNQPVDPGEFLRHARFEDVKTQAKLDEPLCLTKAPQKDLVLRLHRPASNEFRMVLDEDLAGHGAEVGLGGPVEVRRQVPRAFALLAAEVSGPAVDRGASVRLRFSRKLNTSQQPPRPAVEPPVEDLKVHVADRFLNLTGSFAAGRRYTIAVPATLLAADGKTLPEGTSATVEIPEFHPEIRFDHRQGILSPWGKLTLDAKGVNIEQLELRSWHVHANNLVPYLHGTDVDATSQSLPDKTLAVHLSRSQPKALALDLRELQPRPLGIYRLEARAAQNHWTWDSALVTVTDLAITAKRHREGYLVWVTSLRSAQPVPDVVVDGITYNNQRVATARTDADGIARLVFAGGHPDGRIWVITASKDADQSYLVPDENQWMIDDVEQSGRPYASHYEAMVYTDRGVYRPGETIHLTGVVRDAAGTVPSLFPLSLRVYRPDGREVADAAIRRRAKDQGLFHTDFTPSAQDQTGPYRFCITLPGSSDALGSATALVEAFVPIRMEVKASPSRERYGPNEPPTVQVSGRYLWDQPAGDLPVKLDGTLRPIRFDSRAHPDYRFGLDRREAPIPLPPVDGQLDEKGQSQVQAELPKSLKAGLYRVHLSATVTEPGGRSVSSNTTATLDLLGTHIGLRSPKGQIVPIGETVSVDWVRQTGQDQPAAPGGMTVQLVRVRYDTVLKQVDGKYIWQSTEKTEQVGADQAIPPTGAAGSFTITCPDWGSYRVIVTDGRSGSCTWLPLYASHGDDGSQSVPMNQPQRVEVVTDRGKYLPGETAKVMLRSPIPGTVLLTLETDRVVARQIARIEQNTCELEVPFPADLRGSAFVTATVVRAVDPNQERWLPHRGLGMTRILMDHAPHRMPVTIGAPAKAQPGETVSITVDTGRPSDPNQPTLVHVWAVDEGILLTSAYQTPDVFTFFLGPRAPGVSTADIFDWLLPDYQRPGSTVRIGGDGFELDALRRSPVPTRTRAPAVVWREAVAADAEGRVTIPMSLPDLTGELRIMAVAVDQDRYGASEHAVTVTAPLLAEASWPRFAAPGDRFTVPLKLFNSTDRPVTVQIKTDVSGPVELSAQGDDLAVEPGKPATRWLQAQATAMGPVQATIEAAERDPAAAPLVARNTATLPIRPATALHTVVELKTLPAGRQIRIEPPDVLVKGTVQQTISVSSRPSVELAAALEEQIHYPYGCVEQTSSRVLSLVYASRILGPSRAAALDDMVKAGIARLWSMQTRSGGLSYWPGDATPDLWGTAYAASCLLEARNAGYEIDSCFTDDLAKFLESRLRALGYEAPDINTRALICRVLVVFGQPPHGWMARLAEQKDRLDLAGLAHLAEAFHAAGSQDKALSLLPDSPPLGTVATTTTGCLTSQVQQEAVWLSALLEIEPNHPMTAALAMRLNKARSNGQWGSTLNNAAVIAALARYQATAKGEDPDFTGAIEPPGGQAVRFDHREPVSLELTHTDQPVQVSSEGRGTIYVVVTTRGLIRDDLVQPYQRQLNVERRWTNRQGEPVDPNSLAVGDLVQVEITIRTTGPTVHNIAIVDALAGGMEVENPRLATSARTGEPEGDLPDHVEFLDDRVVLFCSAASEPRTFKYSLRATTAGAFALPPIQASCMYDESVACLGKAGRVTIRAR
jgi:hypothetical protein